MIDFHAVFNPLLDTPMCAGPVVSCEFSATFHIYSCQSVGLAFCDFDRREKPYPLVYGVPSLSCHCISMSEMTCRRMFVLRAMLVALNP
jgi:hypothetical protein